MVLFRGFEVGKWNPRQMEWKKLLPGSGIHARGGPRGRGRTTFVDNGFQDDRSGLLKGDDRECRITRCGQKRKQRAVVTVLCHHAARGKIRSPGRCRLWRTAGRSWVAIRGRRGTKLALWQIGTRKVPNLEMKATLPPRAVVKLFGRWWIRWEKTAPILNGGPGQADFAWKAGRAFWRPTHADEAPRRQDRNRREFGAGAPS